MTMSSASAPVASIFARVVSKCVLLGIFEPLWAMMEKSILSEARRGVGMIYLAMGEKVFYKERQPWEKIWN